MGMMELIGKARIEAFMSCFVRVHPHETSALFYSTSTFFFILSAYFLVLPLRDEGAISLGLGNLPELFIGSLLLTLVAAPLFTLIFSLPNLSKRKALVFIHRFFSASLVVFFILFLTSSPGTAGFNFKGLLRMSSTIKQELKVEVNHASGPSDQWSNNGWFYKAVRICLFLWVALLNLITISSTWARVIDVMDTESGSRLFGFIGAGATFGQLFGSVLATIVAWLGPYLLLFAAILMELAAQSAKGIERDTTNLPDGQLPIRKVDSDDHLDLADEHSQYTSGRPSPKSSTVVSKPQFWSILDGIRLILSSTYLIYVALFLWLSAVVSSFFYFQKVTVIASSVTNPVQRRRVFAQINSFIAVFILGGQLTVTGRILTIFGVTAAISCTPVVAIINLIAIALWPTWIAVAICETLRKVTTYVVTRPGRELLFTVVSQDEKYKAKVCIDVIVQRLGDASAAGMYKLLHSTVKGNPSTASLYALPVCVLWILTAFHLGHRQVKLAKLRSSPPHETSSNL